jgi:hypothetical protein
MKIAVVLAFCITSLAAFAQEDSSETLSPHMAGASASMMTGYGLTYGYFFDAYTAIKVKAFAFISEEGQDDDESVFEIGAEYQQTFFRRPNTRVYFLAGGYYWIERDEYSYYYQSSVDRNIYRTNEYALGFAAGFEYALWRHFLVNVDLGITYRHMDRTSVPPNSYDFDYYPQTYLGVGGGLGLMYRF